MKRITTSIDHLDAVLGGGFPEASVNVIAGAPGTGKTVLVQQLVCGLASPGRKVLFLSTVNEPMHKVLRYVQRFPFFDPAQVGKSLFYEDLGPMLVKAPVEEVLGAVGDMVMKQQPAVLVIDSFRALGELALDPVSYRRALYDLTGVLTSTGCTTFLVGEYGEDEVLATPEAAVADSIVQLLNERRGIRNYRYLSVVKLRGSSFVDGHHAFRITGQGVRLFPRFTTPATPAVYAPGERRVSTGVPALDEMLGGGLLEGSSTLVLGPAGSGKTSLSLATAFAAVRRNVPVAVVTFGEDPSQLVTVARRQGFDVPRAVEQGLLRMLYVSPIEIDIDEHILRIVDTVAESGARCVVLDSLSDFESAAFDETRFRNYIFSLVQYFKDRGITSLMTYERGSGEDVGGLAGGVSRFADNIVRLTYADVNGGFGHCLQVVKTRGSSHSYDLRPFHIDAHGLQLSPPPHRAR